MSSNHRDRGDGPEELRPDEEGGDGCQPESTPQHQLPPAPPIAELPAGHYLTSEEHLWDELRRIDQLVRAQTVRWRSAIGDSKPDDMWGMVNVSDAEVNAYLQAPLPPFDDAPEELAEAIAAYWHAAESMAEVIRGRVEEAPPEVELRLEMLTEVFDLAPYERDVLLVCLLPELDGRYRRLYGYLQDDASRPNPSVELVLQILSLTIPDAGVARSIFAADSPLMINRLLVTGGAESFEALPVRSVRVDDRITAFLTGGDEFDGRLQGIVSEVPEGVSWDDLIVDPGRLRRLRELVGWWEQLHEEEGEGATLFLHGPYGSGRLAFARAFCADARMPLLVADTSRLLRAPLTEDELLIGLAYREARLRGAAIYWLGVEQLLEGERRQTWEQLAAAAETFEGMTFIGSQRSWEASGHFRGRHFLRLDFPVPGFELRKRLWAAHLPPPEEFVEPAPARDELAEQLANGFQMTEGQITDAVAAAREHAVVRRPLRPRLEIADLFEGCRRQSSRRLIKFARRIESPKGLTFDHLVLPPINRRQLEELRRRISQRHRVRAQFEHRLALGQGLITLFTGSSGTGKTMAAGLLAQEQRVDLYKVDLSAVVSKWVGETEKNLDRVFAEAEDANAIIFFDEGEALFGQRSSRTESSGQDRWANMEVNFLLQRVEEYTGVVIIASNLRQNIDEAFVRRIHKIVEFPFPSAEARFHIWVGMFPPDIERPPDEQVVELANQFHLSGGQISNIVVDAAFRALAEAGGGRPRITKRLLVLGVAREYQKLGKPIREDEFGTESYRWIEAEIL